MPDVEACERARRSRDPRFDGLFFTAVTSTGIYCRPVCPAPAPLARHVRYYPNAAAAEAAGFRPCLRCRPELAPGDPARRHGDDVVARTLALIDAGALTEAPMSTLAAQVRLSERQLRRLFVERLGAPPVGVHGTRRLLLAKQLLTDTSLPVTEVAMAAGFNSLRRFNTVFRDAYRMAPRDLRRQAPRHETSAGLTLRLGFRPPCDFEALLAFLRQRALPGIEVVTDDSYARAFSGREGQGWWRVSRMPARRGESPHALRLEVFGARPAVLLPLVTRIRRMFDLDADPHAIAAVLGRDPRLRPLVRRSPGLRVPGAWDAAEIAVRAIIGQQVSVAAARTIATRLARRHGEALPPDLHAIGLTHLFPTIDALADQPLDGLGLTRDRALAIRTLAKALVDGRVNLAPGVALDDFVAQWTTLPGVGRWTAHYLAMRALSHPDACPVEDLILRRALPNDGTTVSPATLRRHAEAWRPWRAYAVMHLWRDAAHARPSARTTRSSR